MKSRTNKFFLLKVSLFLLTLFTYNLTAQSVILNNNIEFEKTNINNDLNSIKIPVKNKIKVKKKRLDKSSIKTVEDLEQIIERRKRLRYRSRRTVEKCFAHTEEVCKTPKEK